MSNAARQKKRRERLKAEGFAQRTVYVHKVDQERFDAFMETLARPTDARDQHHEQPGRSDEGDDGT